MNMRLLLLSFVLLTGIAGCNRKEGIPSDILPQDKMQAILSDIMRADQFLNDYVLSKDSSLNKDSARIEFYKQVFNIHKTSKSNFQKSFSYYKLHPARLKVLLDSNSVTKAPTDVLPQLATDDTSTQVKPVPQSSIPLDTVRPKRKLKKSLPLN